MRATFTALLLVTGLGASLGGATGCQTRGRGDTSAGSLSLAAKASPSNAPADKAEAPSEVRVLPRAGEALTDAERASEAASVTQVLSAFLADARPYVGATYRLKATIVLDPTLRGEETHQPEPGVCEDETHTVVLNRNLWLAYTEPEREVVLYHELGHCELARRHTTGRRAGGGPVSLMNRNSVADVRYFEADRAYYLHELFTNYPSPVHYRLHSTSAYTPPETPGPGH